MTGPFGGAPAIAATLADAFRDEWGKVVATLTRLTGDLDLAEECAQDAFAKALDRWPVDGLPDRPGAWLTTVARNRALDVLRRAGTEQLKLREVAALAERDDDAPPADDASAGAAAGRGQPVEDDRLRLIFTCCHPALPLDARVALTLRSLAGLTTAEIARAFLVSEATMAKRLVRAKQKIKNAGIPYRVPPPELLPERTSGVLAVLYLTFNEGYLASGGDELIREGLCGEAIRLATALASLLPAEPETKGLLALLLLQHSRRAARVDEEGDLVTLEHQDRSLWDRAEVARAFEVLRGMPPVRESPGPYRLQAEIAACHARAATSSATDWSTIADLYTRLLEVQPSVVVELNRAVAVAMADGAEAGLAILDDLGAGALEGYYLFHATRADLLRRLGRNREAETSYRRALELTAGPPERRYLARRLAEVGGDPGPAV